MDKSSRFLLKRYCLPDSFYFGGFGPETSSRVTLASLGTVFQTVLVVWLFSCSFVYIAVCASFKTTTNDKKPVREIHKR